MVRQSPGDAVSSVMSCDKSQATQSPASCRVTKPKRRSLQCHVVRQSPIDAVSGVLSCDKTQATQSPASCRATKLKRRSLQRLVT